MSIPVPEHLKHDFSFGGRLAARAAALAESPAEFDRLMQFGKFVVEDELASEIKGALSRRSQETYTYAGH